MENHSDGIVDKIKPWFPLISLQKKFGVESVMKHKFPNCKFPLISLQKKFGVEKVVQAVEECKTFPLISLQKKFGESR